MPEAAPNPELLRSLGRLARGLSAVFWGLLLTPIVCLYTARAAQLNWPGVVPSFLTTGLLVYGLWQMGGFQRQERPWRLALDRAKLLGFVNLSFCPFLYWYNRAPEHLFFAASLCLFGLAGVLFLFNLNLVLARLGAMLPDETLRQETRQFTALNRDLLVLLLVLTALYLFLKEMPGLPPLLARALDWVEETNRWRRIPVLFLPLVPCLLLPLAMTMALLWKTKEIILDGVFGPKR